MVLGKGLNKACIKFTDDDKAIGADSDDVLKILEVHSSPQASMTQSTLATGETIYDSKVVLPTEISCKCSLEIDSDGKWSTVLKKISEAYNRVTYDSSRSNLATITSKTSVYKYCALQNCPHMESAEYGDVFYFTLKFKQMIFVSENGIVHPDNDSDSDAKYVGNV